MDSLKPFLFLSLSIQAFLSLQGIDEETRYKYLTEVVSGQRTLKDLKVVLRAEKQLQPVKKELMRQLNTDSWEETLRLFPCHTTEAMLEPYRGIKQQQKNK